MSQASADLLGDRYRLVTERASFPFGALWEAEDDQGARTLVLRFDPTVTDPAEKVAAAMESAARVNSLQVVPWGNGGLDADGAGWLAAPMYGPWSLQEHVVRNEGLAPYDAAPIMHQVARTMAVAEGQGIIHHCLNSNFIRLVPIPEGGYAVKLYGYGLHGLLPPYKPLRKKDAYLGVPDYMAPELCAGKPAAGSADVYAIGIAMYEAIRGRPPFAPTFASASASTTLKRQIFEKPLALHVRHASMAHIKAFEAVALKALAKTAARRQNDIAALEAELEGLITGDMRSSIVTLSSAVSRPTSTSRRLRTQVLQSAPASAEIARAISEAAEDEPRIAKGLASVEETAVEETAVEETAVEESAVEETAVEETAVEETAVEAASTEEDDDFFANAPATEEEDDAQTVEAPRSKRGPGTLVFAGLGPTIRERAGKGATPRVDATPPVREAEAADAGQSDDGAAEGGGAARVNERHKGAESKDDKETGDDKETETHDHSSRSRRNKKKKKKGRRRSTSNATRSHGSNDGGARRNAGESDEKAGASQGPDESSARNTKTVMGMKKVDPRDVAQSIEHTDERPGLAARPPRRQDAATVLEMGGVAAVAAGAKEEADDWFVSSSEAIVEVEETPFIVEKKPPYFWYAAIGIAILVAVILYVATSGDEADEPKPTSAAALSQGGPKPMIPTAKAPVDRAAELLAAQTARDRLRAPVVAPTPTEPVVAPTPTEPVVAPTPTEPAVAVTPTEPTPTEPAVAVTPTEPTPTEPKPTEPAVAVVPTPVAAVIPTPTPTTPAVVPTPAPTEPVVSEARKAAEAHYLDGRRARADGQLSAAESHFRRAVSADPSYAAARSALGQVKRARAKIASAAKPPTPKPTAPRPTTPKPTTPTAGTPETDLRAQSKHYLQLGVKAYKAENFKLAAKYFEKAKKLDSGNVMANRYLGMAREKL